jgi:hypothetical protein
MRMAAVTTATTHHGVTHHHSSQHSTTQCVRSPSSCGSSHRSGRTSVDSSRAPRACRRGPSDRRSLPASPPPCPAHHPQWIEVAELRRASQAAGVRHTTTEVPAPSSKHRAPLVNASRCCHTYSASRRLDGHTWRPNDSCAALYMTTMSDDGHNQTGTQHTRTQQPTTRSHDHLEHGAQLTDSTTDTSTASAPVPTRTVVARAIATNPSNRNTLDVAGGGSSDGAVAVAARRCSGVTGTTCVHASLSSATPLASISAAAAAPSHLLNDWLLASMRSRLLPAFAAALNLQCATQCVCVMRGGGCVSAGRARRCGGSEPAREGAVRRARHRRPCHAARPSRARDGVQGLHCVLHHPRRLQGAGVVCRRAGATVSVVMDGGPCCRLIARRHSCSSSDRWFAFHYHTRCECSATASSSCPR